MIRSDLVTAKNPTRIPISVCIITKNAAETLRQCILSVRDFADIVVMDSGSDDQTCEIAMTLRARLYHQSWLGFGAQKNACIALAEYPWVLSLDSDEIVTPQLVEELNTLDLSSPDTCYMLRRVNFFLGKKIRFSGWGNDWNIRLFNRDTTQFLDRFVHESVIPTPHQVKLKGSIIHYPYRNQHEMRRKTRRYAQLAHEQRQKEGRTPDSIWTSALRALLGFLRPYVLKLGFLDGFAGLQIAWMGAAYTYRKYRGFSASPPAR